MMPIAMYSAAGLVTTSARGMKPPSTSATGGAASATCTAKQAKITSSIAMMNASSARKPWRIRYSTRNTSTARSEEHTSELQSLMRISYAVFCLKKKTHNKTEVKTIENKRKYQIKAR